MLNLSYIHLNGQLCPISKAAYTRTVKKQQIVSCMDRIEHLRKNLNNGSWLSSKQTDQQKWVNLYYLKFMGNNRSQSPDRDLRV